MQKSQISFKKLNRNLLFIFNEHNKLSKKGNAGLFGKVTLKLLVPPTTSPLSLGFKSSQIPVWTGK